MITLRKKNRPGTQAVIWRSVSFLLGMLAGLGGISACTGPVPTTPYPTVVRVVHPEQAPVGKSYEDLEELYSASPERNPDGLGVLRSIWLNSRITLLTWPALKDQVEKNRIAFARDKSEHQLALRQARALFDKQWVFAGILLGDFDETLEVEFYEPHGIYLIDDKGRKFLPLSVEDRDPLIQSAVRSRIGVGRYTLPLLIFPKQAITSETRAISLYLAALHRRVRFSWIFDPNYDLPLTESERLGSGEANRLFRRN